MNNSQVSTTLKKLGEVHLDAKIMALTQFLKEIEEQDYLTISQVKGAINNEIDILNKTKKEQ